MTVEGLWTVEVFGLWGWENRGVLVLRDGHAIGGGNHHYTVGRYSVDGDEVCASMEVRYHGQARTMFGSAEQEFILEVSGERQGEQITGEIHRVDRPDMKLAIRLTRRADIE